MKADEFAAKTLSEGGASRHAFTGQAPPEQGYMVGSARTRSGESFPEHTLERHQFHAQAVEEHANRIQRSFSDSDDVYQGSWANAGKIIMDASNYISSRLVAKTMGRQRGEKAIYDLGGQRDIQTSPGAHKAGAHKASKTTPATPTSPSVVGGKHRYEGKHAAGVHKAGKHKA